MNQVSVLKSILTIGLWSFLSMPLAFAQEGEGSVLPSNLKLPPQIPSLNIKPIGPKINPNAIDLLAQNGNPVAKKKAAEKLKERQKAKEAEQSDQAQNVAGVNQSEDETTGSSGAAKNNKAIKNKPAKGGKKADAEKEDEQWRKVDPKAEDDDKLGRDFVSKCAVQPKEGTKFRLDIYEEELESVVKLIACIKMRNIILPKSLKGKKITIYSPVYVTTDEAYKAFLTALESNGLTISKQGKFWKIIEIKDYARASDPIEDADTPAMEDRMITQVIPFKHVDAQEINEVISKLTSANAQIIIYQPNNSMIITELASNLRKIKSLVEGLDVPGGEEQLWTYQVLHADVADISQKIQDAFNVEEGKGKKAGGGANNAVNAANAKNPAGANPAGKVGGDSSSVGQNDLEAKVSKVIADERTNRLFIMASARSYAKVKAFIAKLDVSVEGDGQVHIHQLNHAKAEDLSNVLSGLSQEQQNKNGAKKGGANAGGGNDKGGKGKGGAGAGANSAALFEGEVTITADEDTNSLVITASFKDYISLKKVIEILDRPRRQVFIEALIMEVSARNQRDFGLSLHGATEGSVSGETVPLLFSNQGSTKSFDLSSAATLTGLAVATKGPASGVTVAGIDLPSFGAILKALAKSDEVNIMSTPHILTTDNEEAEIVVGSTVPFITGAMGGGLGGLGGLGGAAGMAGMAGGLGRGLGGLGGFGMMGGFMPIQRQDVALNLKITPRINAANFVTLEIDQVIEEIESIDPQMGPTTSKRSIKSTVVVKDQNTVVIGGLQKSRQINNRTHVPWLGEIPLIGYFFRDSKRDRQRTNLLLLLTPHVIETPDDFREIFQRKMEEHREFVARFQQTGEEMRLGLDFGKKHGLVEAMHKSIKSAQEELDMIDELKKQEQPSVLPQDMDGISIEDLMKKKAGESAPATETTPAPATETTPAPATETTPAPATETTPTPATETTPAPATDDTAIEATDQKTENAEQEAEKNKDKQDSSNSEPTELPVAP